MQRKAEVIEASTTEFAAECYELYGLPPLGSLVKTADGETQLYAVVYSARLPRCRAGTKTDRSGQGRGQRRGRVSQQSSTRRTAAQ